MEFLAPHVGKSNTTNVSYIGVCGPPGFNRKVEEILQELEFPKANLFIF